MDPRFRGDDGNINSQAHCTPEVTYEFGSNLDLYI